MGPEDDSRKNTADGKILLEGNQSKQMAPKRELATTKPKVSRCFLFLTAETRLSGCQAPD